MDSPGSVKMYERSDLAVMRAVTHLPAQASRIAKAETNVMGFKTAKGLVRDDAAIWFVMSPVYPPPLEVRAMVAQQRRRRDAAGETEESRHRDATGAGETQRILLVDDEKVLLDVYTLLLEAEGYAVTTRIGAQEGFEALVDAIGSGQPFDLLITDFVMPGNRGNVLIKALRELEKDDSVSREDQLPILLLTGVALSTLSGLEQDDLMTPGVSYLSKRNATEQLIPTVKRLLRRSTQASDGSA